MAKREEYIRQEWIKIVGEYNWDYIKVDDNGYAVAGEVPNDVNLHDMKKFMAGGNQRFRPESLEGLESNFGWTRIETEADLPINKFLYVGGWLNAIKGRRWVETEQKYSDVGIAKLFAESNITHYRIYIPHHEPLF